MLNISTSCEHFSNFAFYVRFQWFEKNNDGILAENEKLKYLMGSNMRNILPSVEAAVSF